MIYGINDKTYDILFGDYYLDATDNNNIKIVDSLDSFTKNRKENKNITYNADTKIYTYNDGIYNMRFSLISDYIDNKRLVSELTTDKRYGKCHIRSVYLMNGIKNTKLITGYLNILDKKIIHSIVMLPNGDIADWTRNIIMSKADYYYLTGFEELQVIDDKDIRKDSFILDDFPTKPYMTFRDEIIDDLKKNIKVFTKK